MLTNAASNTVHLNQPGTTIPQNAQLPTTYLRQASTFVVVDPHARCLISTTAQLRWQHPYCDLLKCNIDAFFFSFRSVKHN